MVRFMVHSSKAFSHDENGWHTYLYYYTRYKDRMQVKKPIIQTIFAGRRELLSRSCILIRATGNGQQGLGNVVAADLSGHIPAAMFSR